MENSAAGDASCLGVHHDAAVCASVLNEFVRTLMHPCVRERERERQRERGKEREACVV